MSCGNYNKVGEAGRRTGHCGSSVGKEEGAVTILCLLEYQ